jgi:hypothetical protein
MRSVSNSSSSSMIGQPAAVVLIVLILGASIYMWQRGQLRSRAGLVTIGGIIAFLIYVAWQAGSSVP